MLNGHPQQFKGEVIYFPQVTSKCPGCEKLSKQIDIYKDVADKRHNTLLNILEEHTVLLDRIANQNAVVTNFMEMFPIKTEEKLKEFDAILVTHSDRYVRQIKSLLARNAERNLHQVFGQNIIMNFNVDGSFGKNRLRDFPNVFKVIIDVISSFSETADKTLRSAFQRQKKKFFKQLGRIKAKNNNAKEEFEDDSSNK